MEGQFSQYTRKLSGTLKKEPIKKLSKGDIFGIEILRPNKSIDYTIVSETNGKVLKFKKAEVEMTIGDLSLIEKRKKKLI